MLLFDSVKCLTLHPARRHPRSYDLSTVGPRPQALKEVERDEFAA